VAAGVCLGCRREEPTRHAACIRHAHNHREHRVGVAGKANPVRSSSKALDNRKRDKAGRLLREMVIHDTVWCEDRIGLGKSSRRLREIWKVVSFQVES
jgi:hypothetical protein